MQWNFRAFSSYQTKTLYPFISLSFQPLATSILIISIKQTSSPIEPKEGRPVKVTGFQHLSCHSNRQSGNIIIMVKWSEVKWSRSVVSDSWRPHGLWPTRLLRPWDFPGKNTGVGCHFLLQCMKVKRESEVALSCLTLCDLMDCGLPGSSVHGILQARVLEWVAIAFSRATVYGVANSQTWLSD